MEKRFAELRKALSRIRTQKPNSDTKLDVASLSPNTYSYIKVVNDHYNIKLHDLGVSEYYPADEPDYNQCKLIIQTDHYGRKLFDDSMIPATVGITKPVDPDIPKANVPQYPRGQDITCHGDPRLEDGFDRGYGDPTNSKKRQALHFNRTGSLTQWQDYIQVREQALTDSFKSFRVADNTRLSYLIRVKMDSLESNGSDGLNVTLFHHYNSGNDGTRIYLSPTGQMRWTLEKGGVTNSGTTTNGVVTTGQDVELGFAWDNAGATDADRFKFYKDGVLQTTTTTTAAGFSSGSTDMFIGKRGSGDGGYVQGYIILAKIWAGVTHSASAFLRHFTNKLTIANIAYGKVATTEESVPRNL